MAVDSVGGGGGSRDPSMDMRRRLLEQERARELDRIEERYKAEVAKTAEARSEALRSIYENQIDESEQARQDADERIERVKTEADQRIRSFQQDAARLTEEAKRQFQSKAAQLARHSDEMEQQREFLVKQHNDSMKKLKEDRERAHFVQELRLNQDAQKAYLEHRRKMDDMQYRGQAEIGELREDLRNEKNRIANDMTHDIELLKHQRAHDASTMRREIDFQKRTATEQLEREQAKFRLSKNDQLVEHEERLFDLNRRARSEVNKKHLEGKALIRETQNIYAKQVDDMKKSATTKVREIQNQSALTQQTIENEAKMQEQMARKAYEHKKKLLHDRREEVLSKYNKDNTKIREKLTEDYRTQSQTIAQRHKDLLVAQNEKVQKELKTQRQIGRRQFDAITAANAQRIADHANRASDPFYQAQSLNTRMSENEKEVILRMDVPEHEQQLVRVTNQRGGLAVSGTRRAEAKVKLDNGHEVTTHSYQSFSETVPVESPLKFNQLVRSYEDGVLTIRIPKA